MRTLLRLMLPLVVVVCAVPAAWADAVNPLDPPISPYGSRVTDVVTGAGPYLYDFTVWNATPDVLPSFQPTVDIPDPPPPGTPVIRDWELPYFSDAGIANIVSPAGWTYAIETIGQPNGATGWGGMAGWQNPTDPWYQGPSSPYTTVTQVLHWYTLPNTDDEIFFWPDGILPQNFLAGFSFTAAYGPTQAPYQASWAFLPIRTGDPAFPAAGLPGSPATLGAAVPLPGAGAMGVVLLGALLAMRLRRRRS